MIYLIVFLVCFGASIIGTICGIGGGVIIKPVLDAFGVMDVTVISFLSGCTVLSMSTYSFVKNKLGSTSAAKTNTAFPLVIGAAGGGVAGKVLFQYILSLVSDQNKVAAIQALCLLIITIGTLIYTICKARIKTHHITSTLVCILIGIALGMMSSFLGIGGGPINLVVLFYFFSMKQKTAAENSLYIIFFSQLASLVQTIVTGSVPDFSIGVLMLMVVGGIFGGVCGHALHRKMEEKTSEKLFIGLMAAIILINAYNIYKFF